MAPAAPHRQRRYFGGRKTNRRMASFVSLQLHELSGRPCDSIRVPGALENLHRRLCLFVDTIKSDSLMDDANFSVKRWLHVKRSLRTSQENAVWWDRQMMAPLKELGRAAVERQKSASRAAKEFTLVGPSTKAPETSASDWCHTNMQCRAVCVGVTVLNYLLMFLWRRCMALLVSVKI